MDPTSHFPAEQCLMLNDVSRIIASQRNLTDLFHDLAERLHRLVDFSYLGVMLYDPAQHVLRLHTLESAAPGPLRAGAAYAVDAIPSGWVWQQQQPLVIGDLDQETRFPQALPAMRAHQIRSFCSLPLSTVHRRLGTLAIGHPERDTYSPSEVAFAQLVAAQVAVAVDNALHSQEAQALQQQLTHERDRLQVLLDVTNSVMANLELRDVLRAVSATLRRVMHCDAVGVQVLIDEVPRLYTQRRPENVREKGSDAVRTNFAAHMYSKPFAKLARHPRMVKPVMQIFGEPVYRHQLALAREGR